MIGTWFVPSWCGDFRLEAVDEGCCKLIAQNLTPGEIDQLAKFIKKARSKGWVDQLSGLDPKSGELLIRASVNEAGHTLIAKRGPRRGIITVIKSSGGKVRAIKGEDPEAVDQAAQDAKAETGKEAQAVTTRRPTLCCPKCVSGPDLRASEALAAFCTPKQWLSWIKNGYLETRGGTTGCAYRLYHRHHPEARRRGFLGVDLESDGPVHAYDWSLPPAEEVLSIKHALEHAESWVRNPAGGFFLGSLTNDVFDGPVMADGIRDGAIPHFLAGVYMGIKGVLKR